MIRTIRSVTGLPIAVDANQGWKDREKALDEIFWLKEQGVVMVEQPMANLDDNAWLTENDLFAGVTVESGRLVLPDRPGIGLIKL